MSPLAPSLAASVLASNAFWQKAAGFDKSAMTEERNERIFSSFVDGMKTAGFDPLCTFGIVLGFADMNGSQKSAALKSAFTAPAVPAAAPMAAPAFGGLWDKFTSGVGNAVDHVKATFGNDQAVQDLTLGAAAKEHPTMHALASSLYGDDKAGLAKFYADISGKVPGHEQNIGGALTSAWGALKSKPFVKEWAPAVIPGLATMAAGRLAGADWSTSALLGLGVGGLHAKATQAGGYAPLYHNVMGDSQAAPPARSPASAAAHAATTAAAAAARPKEAPGAVAPAAAAAAPAAQTMNQNGANAAAIAKQPDYKTD